MKSMQNAVGITTTKIVNLKQRYAQTAEELIGLFQEYVNMSLMLQKLSNLELVLEGSLILTDKYLCEADKSNELIQRELNIYRQAPELDEGGL
ncbi:unnamed protein product [Brachionus calyciflorus]|uniref:Uncharacterized protein n=1 Tax=Brachionus calyciflorus TaxID=104777 RepID=A0A814N7F6_9BILA|nr:unnamed protein product [Brachionus calyciflorus]